MTVDRRTLILGASSLAVGAYAVAESNSSDSLPRERVLGFGGFFFRSSDPKALAAWYRDHLGIDPMPTATNHTVWQQAAGPTVFAPFSKTTKYFGAPEQMYMLNFRVRNMDAMVAQLRAANITVDVVEPSDPTGRFARLHDPDGNPIELWEPAPKG
jgi:glyoxylase I family protein